MMRMGGYDGCFRRRRRRRCEGNKMGQS